MDSGVGELHERVPLTCPNGHPWQVPPQRGQRSGVQVAHVPCGCAAALKAGKHGHRSLTCATCEVVVLRPACVGGAGARPINI